LHNLLFYQKGRWTLRIGVPKEVKNNENRVALTPAGVMQLTQHQHQVVIETGAGHSSGFIDELYIEAGAVIADSAAEVWKSEMVIKVKEPTPEEYRYFYDGLILFTYLHLAADRALTKALIDNNVVAIAYETVQLPNRTLPLLTPMSEVAGRIATQIGPPFLKSHVVERVFCSEGSPGLIEARSRSLAAGLSERMPQRLQ
jgi:alanine dehydrogenase